MKFRRRLYSVAITTLVVLCAYECTNDAFENMDKKYYLVSEAYNIAKSLFNQGRNNYMALKSKSLRTIDAFLDLVYIMNDEMAKEVRSAVLKFYKVKYLHDFTNYIISMEEMIDIIEHCLIEPVEKLEQIRIQFHDVIKNFQDSRNFDSVNKCYKELPDEVAVAHCLLHQAVLFNETMQENLVTIVEIKTRQHAQDMNSSLYDVKKCFTNFVPKFFEELLLDAYTEKCGYLRVVNASIADLLKSKWRGNETLFPEKWMPFIRLLKEKTKETTMRPEPLHLTLLAANLSSRDIIKTLY